MVSFRTTHGRDYHNDYWKIPVTWPRSQSTTLKATIDGPGGKRHYTTATNKGRILVLAQRTQRKLRCYDEDSIIELRRSAVQRGLGSAPFVNGFKKSGLIDVLETADEHATFNRLLDLPPEIRTIVYELHFASFPDNACDAIESASPPPITQVNSQIRHETLKLFYHSCQFKFEFIRFGGPQGSASPRATNIMRHLPQDHFLALRNFCVEVPEHNTSGRMTIDYLFDSVKCLIALPAGKEHPSIDLYGGFRNSSKLVVTNEQVVQLRSFFAGDFLRSWPPMLPVEVADTLFSISRPEDQGP